MLTITEEKWDTVTAVVKKVLGFDTVYYNENFVKRRVQVRMRSLNVGKYEEYARKFNADPAEQAALKNELTIHVTNFFRDYSTWQSLADSVIPALAELGRPIRIWSAGCSIGEEPLSVAILCEEAKVPYEIFATDIDLPTIQLARTSSYDEMQFREMPPQFKEKYFDKQGNEYMPKPYLRSKITFQTIDLVKPVTIAKDFDFILCRNTVIYFSEPTKHQLYLYFYDKLTPGGFLLLGRTECLLGPARAKFEAYDMREHIFRKPM